MQPLRIRITRIVDFGLVVSLVGIDVETGMPVAIHVDHRPFAEIRKALREADLPSPVEYEAERLLLHHLEMRPADARGSAFVEQNGPDAAGFGCAAARLLQELDR